MKDVKTLADRHALVEELLAEVRKGRKQNGEARFLLEEALIADFLNPDIDEINLICAGVLLSKAARKRLSVG